MMNLTKTTGAISWEIFVEAKEESQAETISKISGCITSI